ELDVLGLFHRYAIDEMLRRMAGELGRSRAAATGPLLPEHFAEDDTPAALELQLRLHLMLKVVDGLAVWPEGLDLEIRPVGRVLAKEQPGKRIEQRGLSDPIVAVDGGVGPAQLQSELADTFEVTEGEADEPH